MDPISIIDISFDDCPPLPKEISSLGDRGKTWLWFRLFSRSVASQGRLLQGFDTAKQRNCQIGEWFTSERRPGLIQNFLDEIERSLIQEEYLSWIKSNDRRQLAWIEYRLKCGGVTRYIPQPAALTEYQSLIAQIDYWSASLENKIKAMEELRSEWKEIMEADKKLRWFNPRSDEQCSWIIDYLDKFPLPKPPTSEKRPLTPSDSTDKATDIFSRLDRSGWSLAEKINYFRTMRGSWNTHCNRKKNKDKVQCNLILPKSSKDKLTKLANRYGHRPSEIISKLIELAYRRPDPAQWFSEHSHTEKAEAQPKKTVTVQVRRKNNDE